MCGIAGIFRGPGAPAELRVDVVGPMLAAIAHRGPDGEGTWIDREAGIALGHRRLAIVDLSEGGRQPMHSEDGSLVVSFNGEIYNFLELRRELEALGHRFHSTSDTEVLIRAVEAWGLQPALRRFCGMFAFALWDRRARVLHLARDRMGKKPLHVACLRGAVLFASEIKALRAVPGFTPAIDRDAVAGFLARGVVAGDSCIYRQVFKLPPGSSLTLSTDDLARGGNAASLAAACRPWWSLADAAERGRADQFAAGNDELVGALDDLLRQVVRERMVADVPLGAFLSGGIDSATVVSLMQAQSARPVRTFTIAFDESGYDESAGASRVARHLGTDHTQFRLSPDEAMKTIPELPRIWDEPFADESQIPTLLVSRMARREVTVALTGDGGDECFAGYQRHFTVSRLASLLAAPEAARRAAAALILGLSGRFPRRVAAALPLPGRLRRLVEGDSLIRLGRLIEGGEDGLYDRLTRLSDLPLSQAPATADPAGPALDDIVSRVVHRDMAGYLPDDILVKLDRATMAVSLEGRCPLLDHRVVEFSWRLPTGVKVRGGRGKWILREVLARYVPRSVFEGPKRGFDVPVGAWLRGPLRGWAEDLLSPAMLARHDLLDVAGVRRRWSDHLDGRGDHSRALWAVLMLQAWLDEHARSTPADRVPELETAQHWS
ncbi:MAG: asparagine synthase (glutamine-hydrolyzing) [Phreatobacter sp.]|uniref:asparagine synthase (glutamine-hydrolyzing) n=1 Tax=Phreatobacter sp. TaxID=1966341 RepID=UPI001A507B48|nr:asparagine synthase (glutamine-hydrolyzing) [Phreatobacter sp.]MBL8568670.1 asparagine synthase (glutamine-hydrolyzing) [Phreatobacter sp.]